VTQTHGLVGDCALLGILKQGGGLVSATMIAHTIAEQVGDTLRAELLARMKKWCVPSIPSKRLSTVVAGWLGIGVRSVSTSTGSPTHSGLPSQDSLQKVRNQNKGIRVFSISS